MSTSLDLVRFRCGDRVINPTDPRHVGRVCAVNWDLTVRVKWDDTGWREDCHAENLELYDDRLDRIADLAEIAGTSFGFDEAEEMARLVHAHAGCRAEAVRHGDGFRVVLFD